MKKSCVYSLKQMAYGCKNFEKFFSGNTPCSKEVNKIISSYNLSTNSEPMLHVFGEKNVEVYAPNGEISVYNETNNKGETIFSFGTFRGEIYPVLSYLAQTKNPDEENNFSVKYSILDKDDNNQTNIVKKGVEIVKGESFASLESIVRIDKNGRTLDVASRAMYQYKSEVETEELYSNSKNFIQSCLINETNVFDLRQNLLNSNKTQENYFCNGLPMEDSQSIFNSSNLIETMKQENIEYTMGQEQE